MAPAVPPPSMSPSRVHMSQAPGVSGRRGLSELAKELSLSGAGFFSCSPPHVSPSDLPGPGFDETEGEGGSVALSRAKSQPARATPHAKGAGTFLHASASDCLDRGQSVPGQVLEHTSCHVGLDSAALTPLPVPASDRDSEAQEEAKQGCKGAGMGRECSLGVQAAPSSGPAGVPVSADGPGLLLPGSDSLAASPSSGSSAAKNWAAGDLGGAPDAKGAALGGVSSVGGAAGRWPRGSWGLEAGAEDARDWLHDTWKAASRARVLPWGNQAGSSHSGGPSRGSSSGDWRTVMYQSAAGALNLWKAARAEAAERRHRQEEETHLVEWIKKAEIIWDADPMAVVPLGSKTDKSKFREVAPPVVLSVACLGQEDKEEEEEVFDEVPLQDEEQDTASTWTKGILAKAVSFGTPRRGSLANVQERHDIEMMELGDNEVAIEGLAMHEQDTRVPSWREANLYGTQFYGGIRRNSSFT